ncbi:response regulator [Salinimicrobium sp. CDJ15-91]|uniref:Response regulator n=2 Tax=Salinimicrobium oceani TaxID=2722702 RepID=A0ABX1CTC4_9FLAO|nr:response regulator [Salinimicrobium oceani]
MENNVKKILIVDDDVSIGEMLRTLLEFSGYKAIVVNNPKKVEDKVAEEHFDLILLDMRLSGVDGTEICSKLKESETSKHIPVLMMSALSNADKTCKAAGADDFIYKPFEMDDLLSKIKTIIG